MNCWAATIGGCSKITKEHLVSQSTFHKDADYKSSLIRGYGLPWNENQLIEIPFTSMSAKILCQHHNNSLSDLDSEAGKIAKTFLKIKDIFSKKSNESNEDKLVFHHSGSLFERWFLKTFINFQQLYNKNELPPRELVEIVFGMRKYPEDVGLAIFGQNGPHKHSFDQDMKFVQIMNSANQIEFIVFEYFGINYLLPLTDQPMPNNLMNFSHISKNYQPLDEYIEKIKGAQILVHPKAIKYKFGDRQNIEIKFSWDNK